MLITFEQRKQFGSFFLNCIEFCGQKFCNWSLFVKTTQTWDICIVRIINIMIIIDRGDGKNGEKAVHFFIDINWMFVWIVSGLLKLGIWEDRHSHGLKPQNV